MSAAGITATSTKPKKTFPITTFISELATNQIFYPAAVSDNHCQQNASGRVVIIGDVHGMRKSLEALLEKISFDSDKDHLILAGDLVNKGPDSSGVVDLAIRLGASAVRGNHDNAVLNAAADIKSNRDILVRHERLNERVSGPENPQSKMELDKACESEPQCPCAKAGIEVAHSSSTHSTAEQLSAHHLEWLAALPLILRFNLPENIRSPFGESLIVVHAGLVPDVSLENQDPHTIMHMRSLVHMPDDDKFVPAEGAGDEVWIKEWDQWQDKLASKTTVVFGHDAKRRIQLGKYAIGLDSGCLYGNKLSAMVISVNGEELEHRIVQVECADTPVTPKG